MSCSIILVLPNHVYYMLSKNQIIVSGAKASCFEEPCAVIPLAGICKGCALQAHEILWSEMTSVVKPSQQP